MELEEYEFEENRFKEEIKRRIIISLEYWLAERLIDPDKEMEKMGDEDNLIYGRDYNFIEGEDYKTIGDTIEKELQPHNLRLPLVEYDKENVPYEKLTDKDKKEIINHIFAAIEKIIKDDIIKSISKEEENEIKKEVIEKVFKDFKLF